MLKIGELAKRSAVSTKTVRYYELLGLLTPPRRSDAGYRLYDDGDVERLVFVRKAKGLGLSLTEVREVLEVHDARQRPCNHVLALLDQKVLELGQLITDLRAFQQELMRLREESARMPEAPGRGKSICAIVDLGIHARGQQALAWLEARRKLPSRSEHRARSRTAP